MGRLQRWFWEFTEELLVHVVCFVLPARGGARGWTEDHLLVLMPAAKAEILARCFCQNAIVTLRRGKPAYLSPT